MAIERQTLREPRVFTDLESLERFLSEPLTEEELARRKVLEERARKLRSEIRLIGITTADLVHEARLDDEA